MEKGEIEGRKTYDPFTYLRNDLFLFLFNQIVDARDVLVVVSRWYGGTLLGPDRFKHINNAARMVLQTAGFIPESSSPSKKKGK